MQATFSKADTINFCGARSLTYFIIVFIYNNNKYLKAVAELFTNIKSESNLFFLANRLVKLQISISRLMKSFKRLKSLLKIMSNIMKS